jgi:hypothetical protein
MKSCIIATMFIVAMIFTMYNSDSTVMTWTSLDEVVRLA